MSVLVCACVQKHLSAAKTCPSNQNRARFCDEKWRSVFTTKIWVTSFEAATAVWGCNITRGNPNKNNQTIPIQLPKQKIKNSWHIICIYIYIQIYIYRCQPISKKRNKQMTFLLRHIYSKILFDFIYWPKYTWKYMNISSFAKVWEKSQNLNIQKWWISSQKLFKSFVQTYMFKISSTIYNHFCQIPSELTKKSQYFEKVPNSRKNIKDEKTKKWLNQKFGQELV